jgi:hypothetical protein
MNMKTLKTLLFSLLLIGCFNNSSKEVIQGMCFDSSNQRYKLLPLSYTDSIPSNDLNSTLFLLDAVNKNSWKNNIVLIDEEDEKINGMYLYREIDSLMNVIKTRNDSLISRKMISLPKGLIAIGYNDFLNNSNFKEYKESLKTNMHNPIELKISYKFWIVFLHETAHSYQHNNLEEYFLKLNDNIEKKFILELNADYITGLFFAKKIHQELYSQYKDKKDESYWPPENSIDLSGVSSKYKFNIGKRLNKAKKIKMFKKIGEALFNEMLEYGDLLVGQDHHHGSSAERANAFYNGYEDGLLEPYNQDILNELIQEDLKDRINRYKRNSELW